MPAIFVTPVECTPGTAGSFRDVDLDTYVANLGADVTGVILEIASNSVNYYDVGIRKNGSTDARIIELFYQCHTRAIIGVDANHIFEVYVEHSTRQNIYIVGYTTTDFTFNTNAVDKSTATTGSYQDIANDEATGAIAIIYELSPTGTTAYSFSIRKNGSTDDRYIDSARHGLISIVIGCDANLVTEQKIESTTFDLYQTGWITGNATFNTNATDYSMGGTGEFADLTALPAGAIGGVFQITTNAALSWAIRPNGASTDIYWDANKQAWSIVGCDGSQLCEGKIESTAVDFWLIGYFVSGEAPPSGNPYYAYLQQQ